MKAKLIINEKEYEVDLTEEQVKEIENPSKKRWRAKGKESYYFISNTGYVYDSIEKYMIDDDELYKMGNYFKTKEEAEECVKKILFQQQYRDYVNEHNDEINWNNYNQRKYYAFYDFAEEWIMIIYNLWSKNQGAIYATSEQIIKDFIEKIGEDNFKKYILEVENG